MQGPRANETATQKGDSLLSVRALLLSRRNRKSAVAEMILVLGTGRKKTAEDEEGTAVRARQLIAYSRDRERLDITIL